MSSWSAIDRSLLATEAWQNPVHQGGIMAIEICPLASDVGNLADWAAVAVATVGSVAVLMLSRAANRTANASLQLSKRIEEKEDELLLREKQLLFSELTRDVMEALSDIDAIKTHMARGLDSWGSDARFMKAVQSLALATADRERARLHLLPEYVASSVVHAQQSMSQFRARAVEFNDHHVGTEMAAYFFPTIVAAAEDVDFWLNSAFRSLNFAAGMTK
ncbi:hypothetical protein A7X83_02865 [Stenotrophomonas maltophilia]|uniref:Uncharacterized protein n=2 Tax=Stenotrophomonas maltophilia TaxID=40324 RepID=A0A2W6IRV1_STEMA|nr:hypothetical protein A7X83_02865 [Stenotrophomonas maltophilia]